MRGRSVVCRALCGDSMSCAVTLVDYSKSVDIFNTISGLWSIANLSEARAGLAATSLPNQGLAFFAGGFGTSFD